MDELERLGQKLRSSRLRTSEALDARIQALLDEAAVEAPPVQRRSLGRVLQRRIWRSVAVAAAAVLVVVGVTFLGKSAPMTLADVQKALEAQNWMHVRTEQIDTGGSWEMWVCFSPLRLGMRTSGGSVTFEDSQAQEKHVYNPAAKTITVTHRSDTPIDEVASPVQLIKQAIEMMGQQGATLTRTKGERNGSPVEILDITHESVRVVLVCDRLTQLPIELEGWAAEESGDFVHRISARLDYPDTGPTSIYDLGVPRDAKVVDLTPPQEAEELWAAVEACRRDFARSYRAIVYKGHVGRSGKYTPDEIHVIYRKGERCRIDLYMTSVFGERAGEEYLSQRIPAEDVAGLEAWLATRPIHTSFFIDGPAGTTVKRDVQGGIQKERGPAYVLSVDPVEALAWPEPRLAQGHIRLLDPVQSPSGDLIGLEATTQGRVEGGHVRLPQRLRQYFNPERDYILHKSEWEGRRDAAWQEDADWLDGVAPEEVPRDWSRSLEVLEYARTSHGQWYARKIHEPTKTRASITIVYLDTEFLIPGEVLNPDGVTSADGYQDTGVFERAFIKALAEIDARPKWPSPVEVARAYWEALKAERYEETGVLWPGSAAWREYYKNGTPTEYVFGELQEQTGTKYVFVPYASRRHFETQGSYNLKMVLSNERSAKGRYYIVSGN